MFGINIKIDLPDPGKLLSDAAEALGDVAEDVAGAIEDVAEDVGAAFEDVVEDVEEVVEDVGDAFEDVAQDVGAAWDDFVEGVGQVAEDVVEGIGDFFGGAAEVVTGIVTTGTAVAVDVLDDARGLAPHEELIGIDFRPGTFWADLLGPTASVPLKPGEDTTVAVPLPQLPPNADVKRIRARLTVGLEHDLPEPETLDVEVSSFKPTTPGGSEGKADILMINSAITPPPVPSNLRVGLQGGAAFWSREGTVAPDVYDLPDFAEAANLYLDGVRLPPGAEMTLVFVVHSDTPGRVDLEVVADGLEYTVLQTQTWPNLLDGTLRIDRNLRLDFGTVTRIPLDPPASAALGPLGLTGVRIDVSGELGPERLLGDVPFHDGREFTTVSPDYGVAQALLVTPATGFPAGATVLVAGVTAIFDVDPAGAELYVELRGEGGDAPGTDKPLGGVDFQVMPPEGGVGPAWVYAALPQPVAVTAGTPYWIVLRAIRGIARLATGRPPGGGYLGRLLVNRGGQLWKPSGGPAALARLAYLPEPDRQTAPVALGFPELPPQRPEVQSQSQRLTLPVSGGRQPGAIVLTSHARGTTTLANLVQEFAHAGGGA